MQVLWRILSRRCEVMFSKSRGVKSMMKVQSFYICFWSSAISQPWSLFLIEFSFLFLYKFCCSRLNSLSYSCTSSVVLDHVQLLVLNQFVFLFLIKSGFFLDQRLFLVLVEVLLLVFNEKSVVSQNILSIS